MSDERDWFRVESNKTNIVVKIEKPKGWGEGYAVELALGLLEDRYYQIYGEDYKRE